MPEAQRSASSVAFPAGPIALAFAHAYSRLAGLRVRLFPVLSPVPLGVHDAYLRLC